MSILSHGPKSPGCISDGGCFSCVCTVKKSWLENEWSFILHVGGTCLSLFLGKNLCLGTKGGKGGRGDISYVYRLQYMCEMYCNLKMPFACLQNYIWLTPRVLGHMLWALPELWKLARTIVFNDFSFLKVGFWLTPHYSPWYLWVSNLSFLVIRWPYGWVLSPVGAVKCWLLFLTVYAPILSSCSYCYWPNHSFISVSQLCHIVAHTKSSIIYSAPWTCQGWRKFVLGLSLSPLDCTNILKNQ